jgi:hypothetical protein
MSTKIQVAGVVVDTPRLTYTRAGMSVAEFRITPDTVSHQVCDLGEYPRLVVKAWDEIAEDIVSRNLSVGDTVIFKGGMTVSDSGFKSFRVREIVKTARNRNDVNGIGERFHVSGTVTRRRNLERTRNEGVRIDVWVKPDMETSAQDLAEDNHRRDRILITAFGDLAERLAAAKLWEGDCVDVIVSKSRRTFHGKTYTSHIVQELVALPEGTESRKPSKQQRGLIKIEYVKQREQAVATNDLDRIVHAYADERTSENRLPVDAASEDIPPY